MAVWHFPSISKIYATHKTSMGPKSLFENYKAVLVLIKQAAVVGTCSRSGLSINMFTTNRMIVVTRRLWILIKSELNLSFGLFKK